MKKQITNINPKDVRYAYINDPKDLRRMLTLAWHCVGSEQICFAVAVNRVEKNKEHAVIEYHNKADARRTAFGRLQQKSRGTTTRVVCVANCATNSSGIIGAIYRDLLTESHTTLSPAMQTARGVLSRAYRRVGYKNC